MPVDVYLAPPEVDPSSVRLRARVVIGDGGTVYERTAGATVASPAALAVRVALLNREASQANSGDVAARRELSLFRTTSLVDASTLEAARQGGYARISSTLVQEQVSSSRVVEYLRRAQLLEAHAAEASRILHAVREAAAVLSLDAQAQREAHLDRRAGADPALDVQAQRSQSVLRTADESPQAAVTAERSLTRRRVATVASSSVVEAVRAVLALRSAAAAAGVAADAVRILDLRRRGSVVIQVPGIVAFTGSQVRVVASESVPGVVVSASRRLLLTHSYGVSPTVPDTIAQRKVDLSRQALRDDELSAQARRILAVARESSAEIEQLLLTAIARRIANRRLVRPAVSAAKLSIRVRTLESVG